MNLQHIINLVKSTQGIIYNRKMATHVREKSVADYVTQVDLAVQAYLERELHKEDPTIQFIGEETGLQQPDADTYWILDPIDGTTNLMHDYRHSVVSLALCHKGEIAMGIVYDPFHDELFSAIKGEGSRLNGKTIHVSSAQNLSNTIIGIGTARRELARENFERFLRVYEKSQDIRRLGSAALELAYTACGRQGGYFEARLNPWDYAAGMLLISEAGGNVTDWKGRQLDPTCASSVVATNGILHDELLEIINKRDI